MRRQLPLALARTFVVVLFTGSAAVMNPAQGQVRSTMGVSARVVEAGPAWAAASQASRALDAVARWIGRERSEAGWVEWADTATGVLELPAPRVTIMVGGGQRGEGGPTEQEGNGVEPVAPEEARFSAPGSTGSVLGDRKAQSPSRVIISVEHVSN